MLRRLANVFVATYLSATPSPKNIDLVLRIPNAQVAPRGVIPQEICNDEDFLARMYTFHKELFPGPRTFDYAIKEGLRMRELLCDTDFDGCVDERRVYFFIGLRCGWACNTALPNNPQDQCYFDEAKRAWEDKLIRV